MRPHATTLPRPSLSRILGTDGQTFTAAGLTVVEDTDTDDTAVIKHGITTVACFDLLAWQAGEAAAAAAQVMHITQRPVLDRFLTLLRTRRTPLVTHLDHEAAALDAGLWPRSLLVVATIPVDLRALTESTRT